MICKVAQLYAMVGDYEKGARMSGPARSVLRDLGQAVRAASSSIDVAIVELLAGDAAAAEREIRPDLRNAAGHRRDLFPLEHGRDAGASAARAGPRRGSADLDRNG
jgi:hypothetical protein